MQRSKSVYDYFDDDFRQPQKNRGPADNDEDDMDISFKGPPK